MLLRPDSTTTAARAPSNGLEILAIDRGPGMPDVARAREDGYSTAGTLGHGLGSVERQSDFFQIYSQPTGTVALARLWREAPDRGAAQAARTKSGRSLVSSPAKISAATTGTGGCATTGSPIMVADGLGHGLAAHDAATAAIDVFQRLHEESPVASHRRCARSAARHARCGGRDGRGRYRSRRRQLLRAREHHGRRHRRPRRTAARHDFAERHGGTTSPAASTSSATLSRRNRRSSCSPTVSRRTGIWVATRVCARAIRASSPPSSIAISAGGATTSPWWSRSVAEARLPTNL